MIASLFKEENGMAMVVVIGIMLIVTTLAFGAMAVSESDLLLSERDKESMEALHVAEAGIQKALWQLEEQGNAMSPKTFTIPVGQGTAQVNAIQDGSNSWYWTIESTGTAGESHRKIKVTVFNFSIWNMNAGLGSNKSLASGGNGIHGTTSVDGPFYVRGNIELSGTSSIRSGPLFIKTGSLVFNSASATLGEADKYVDAFIEPAEGYDDIVGVKNEDNQLFISRLSNQVPDIKLPPMEELSVYRERSEQESTETPVTAHPSANPAQSGGYKVVDDDGENETSDIKNTYMLNKDIGSFGNAEFGWDQVNRILQVEGTVFVDGNLQIGYDDNSLTKYEGRGTIVANGNITIKGKLIPTTTKMDNDHVLGLVTDDTIEISVNASNSEDPDNPDIAGAFFATESIRVAKNNITFVGSMIAGTLDFADKTNNSHLFTDDSLPTFLPPSLPGSTKFLAMTTAWREVN